MGLIHDNVQLVYALCLTIQDRLRTHIFPTGIRRARAKLTEDLLRSDQKFCNLKGKIKRQKESSSFILLNLQNSPHDYLYKVPSILTVCQKFFF